MYPDRINPFQANLDWFLPRLTEAVEKDAFSKEVSLYLGLVGRFQQGQKDGTYFHETVTKVTDFLRVAEPASVAYEAQKKVDQIRTQWSGDVLANNRYTSGLVTELTEKMDGLAKEATKLPAWIVLSSVRDAVETHVESMASGNFGEAWEVVETFREGFGDPDSIPAYQEGIEEAERILNRYDTFAHH